jgi:hypothetical protein
VIYREYIRSSKWKLSAARLGELEAAGHRCRGCFAPGTAEEPLEVHHRTYERLGGRVPATAIESMWSRV